MTGGRGPEAIKTGETFAMGLHADCVNSEIICDDVIPSRHLEKQLIEVLEIKPDRVKGLARRRQRRAKAGMEGESKKRKAA